MEIEIATTPKCVLIKKKNSIEPYLCSLKIDLNCT